MDSEDAFTQPFLNSVDLYIDEPSFCVYFV